MTTSRSNPVCRRCDKPVYREDSVWCLHVWSEGGKLFHDVVRTSDLDEHEVVLHVRADRECRKVTSGYLGKLCEELEVTDIPRSFLSEL